MKKIGLLFLCLASLGLVGCFHIPDEDYLLSKNKVNSGDDQKDEEINQALDSFMDGLNIISSEWDEIKNEENNGTTAEEGEENTIEIEDETINDEEIISKEVESGEAVDEVVEENIISKE